MKLSSAIITSTFLSIPAYADRAANPLLRGTEAQVRLLDATTSRHLREGQPNVNFSLATVNNSSHSEIESNNNTITSTSNPKLNITEPESTSANKDASYYAKMTGLMIAAMLPVICCICALSALDKR